MVLPSVRAPPSSAVDPLLLCCSAALPQVDDIESKLTELIEMYTEDRKRLQALPLPLGSGDTPSIASLPSTPPTHAHHHHAANHIRNFQRAAFQHNASEPATPVDKLFGDSPPSARSMGQGQGQGHGQAANGQYGYAPLGLQRAGHAGARALVRESSDLSLRKKKVTLQ